MEKLLSNPTNMDNVRDLVTPDATYVSLSLNNPAFKQIMPWCGTHDKAGPAAIVEIFIKIGRHSETKAFNIEALFRSEENVQVNGTFTLGRGVLGITKSSPFAIWCQLNKEGNVTYMRFMEETFGTASSFEKSWKKL
jgi:uncharacterized protein